MECWKRNDPSLCVGDLEELIVMSNDKVETLPSSEGSYCVPPLADQISPVSSGQQTVHSAPWEYKKTREEWRKGG